MHRSSRATWRHLLSHGGMLVLSWLIMLGLTLTGVQQGVESAKPHRDRVAQSDDTRPPSKKARDRVSRERRGDVSASIVGGTKVPQGTHTFAAFVASDAGSCTGSLIEPSFVLTAAHCVEDAAAIVNPARFELIIGRANISNPPVANVFTVSRVFQHPLWDRVNLSYDVAVLQLNQAVPSNAAQPITLVAADDIRFDTPGQAAIAAGWGVTSEAAEDGSPDLLQIGTSVISDAACGVADGVSVLCAQTQGKSTCYGDSGGPLFVSPTTSAAPLRFKEGYQLHASKAKRRKKKRRRHHGDTPPPTVTEPTLIGVSSYVTAPYCSPGTRNGFAQLSAPEVHDFVASALNTPEPPPGSSRATVRVDARIGRWQEVPNFTLRNGEVYSVNVIAGQWTHWEGGRPYNKGDGEPVPCGTADCPLPDYNLGGLVLRVQGADGGLDIDGNGSSNGWIPEGFIEPITLAFRINDAYVGDNDGVLTVEVV